MVLFYITPSQALNTIDYLQFQPEISSYKRECYQGICSRVAFNLNAVSGYVELKRKLPSNKRGSMSFKSKFEMPTSNYSLFSTNSSAKFYGKTDGEISKFALIYKLKKNLHQYLVGEVKLELDFLPPDREIHALIIPAIEWTKLVSGNELNFNIEIPVSLKPCRCPNGKSYYIKELKAQIEYQIKLTPTFSIKLSSEIKHHFYNHHLEKKAILSLRYYL